MSEWKSGESFVHLNGSSDSFADIRFNILLLEIISISVPDIKTNLSSISSASPIKE